MQDGSLAPSPVYAFIRRMERGRDGAVCAPPGARQSSDIAGARNVKRSTVVTELERVFVTTGIKCALAVAAEIGGIALAINYGDIILNSVAFACSTFGSGRFLPKQTQLCIMSP